MIRFFKSPRLFQLIFHCYDLQGDGDLQLTLTLLRYSIQFNIPFNGNKYKARFCFALFGPRYCCFNSHSLIHKPLEHKQ
jgi:hypothetical protein